MKNNWQSYWNNQDDPRHAINDEPFFKDVAKEMRFHLGDLAGKNVLELGCGDGAIVKYLDVDPKKYLGIDFSEPLLNRFANVLPGHEVCQMGAIEFLEQSKRTYDVVFSFGVLQYFDIEQLSKLFALQQSAMSQGGYAFHFGVPVKELRAPFLNGQATQKTAHTAGRSMLKRLKCRWSNNIGNWHSLSNLSKVSANNQLTAQIFGGINYLYRINLRQEHFGN